MSTEFFPLVYKYNFTSLLIKQVQVTNCSTHMWMDGTVEVTGLHLISENEVKSFSKDPLWTGWTQYVMKKGKKLNKFLR